MHEGRPLPLPAPPRPLAGFGPPAWRTRPPLMSHFSLSENILLIFSLRKQLWFISIFAFMAVYLTTPRS